jgi:hypothetical protein
MVLMADILGFSLLLIEVYLMRDQSLFQKLDDLWGDTWNLGSLVNELWEWRTWSINGGKLMYNTN